MGRGGGGSHLQQGVCLGGGALGGDEGTELVAQQGVVPAREGTREAEVARRRVCTPTYRMSQCQKFVEPKGLTYAQVER